VYLSDRASEELQRTAIGLAAACVARGPGVVQALLEEVLDGPELATLHRASRGLLR
jgi:hypothetical protein